jgi:hypothetical protein
VGRLERSIRIILPVVFKITIPVSLFLLLILFTIYWSSVSKFLKTYKDALTAFGSMAGLLGFLYAITISYIKFFAGKLFTLRAHISICTTKGNISEEINLHLVRVIIKNPGSLPLRVAKVVINCTDHCSTNFENQHSIENFSCITDHLIGELKQIIDPGQDSVYYTTRKVSKNVKIVMYEAVLKDFLGNVWTDMILVENES